MLSTCTLMERDEPYCLATELARGTLASSTGVGRQKWSREDHDIPEPIDELLRQALSASDCGNKRCGSAPKTRHCRRYSLASQAIEALTLEDVDHDLG